jgi:hypothetical protein
VEPSGGSGLPALARNRLRRAPGWEERGARGDALEALSQVSGMLSLALGLGDLGLTGDSLEQLVARRP